MQINTTHFVFFFHLHIRTSVNPHIHSSAYLCFLTIVSMNIEFNRSEDWMKQLYSEVKQRIEIIKLGGGKKANEKQKERNKLTARQRVEYLPLT